MENKIQILFQLIANLKSKIEALERSFKILDKNAFDADKKAILDLQSKIKYALKNVN